MKPTIPHDPLDDLIAAALHGELSPEERTQFESRINNDPAAQAAFQEAKAMHDLLEKTHRDAQPDAAFEQRMVSGVRRKLQQTQHRETAWESLLFIWRTMASIRLMPRRAGWTTSLGVIAVLAALTFFASRGVMKHAATDQAQRTFGMAGHMMMIPGHLQGSADDEQAKALQSGKIYLGESTTAGFAGTPIAQNAPTPGVIATGGDLKVVIKQQGADYAKIAETGMPLSRSADTSGANQFAGGFQNLNTAGASPVYKAPAAPPMPQGGTGPVDRKWNEIDANGAPVASTAPGPSSERLAQIEKTEVNYWARNRNDILNSNLDQTPSEKASAQEKAKFDANLKVNDAEHRADDGSPPPTVTTQNGAMAHKDVVNQYPQATPITKPDAAYAFGGKATPLPAPIVLETPPNQTSATPTAPADNRKLIRNANLDLEVTSFQDTVDKIGALTKTAGGYVDTSHSEKGGNGKLQGTVVVKVLPENLDAFLLKLRDLGTVQNQSVSTEDVTKDYFDTQARLVNSQKMEAQLQDLLKRENGKVADLLQVERELGRVRGDIEQMQGQLKLYDFQVQYATVTMQIAEKDLKQAAAYLLKEQDDFSLYATDVEETFQKSRAAAESSKGQVLVATLNHNSGSDVSALLVVSVPPEQIDEFLAQIRSLGRVANFTRDTKRVAKDGGDSNQPADATQTEKDKIMVNVSIHSDDESRKQVALTVVTKAVDTALDDAKTAALGQPGVEILSSSLNKAAEGQSTAQLSVRVPGKDYAALMDSLRALGRTQSLTIQRNDNSGPGASGDDAPVIVSLSLTDDDTPVQQTDMSVLGSNVDDEAQQMKKAAGEAGVEVKASSFERSPDGTEQAQMTFRMPMAKYAGFVESLKRLGKVESLSVKRDDRPDETRADDSAPAEINLTLHNQRDVVPDNDGLWATIRQTFGEGATALFSSVRTIGVIIAFLVPWVVTLLVLAWIARRIYLWRKR